jgi:L-alanine-DL-glutamate epimerase-like enolase superfamily enzyme
LTRDWISLRARDGAGPSANPPRPQESGSTYACVAGLPVAIERCELLPLVRDTSGGFTKVSIVVRLSGGGHHGEGEDVTWDQIDQIEFLRGGDELSWLRGTRTFDEFSTLLGLADLFPVEPIRDSARFYRRWAFESAALDLALRQSGLSLQEAVGRAARPVSFVVSFRIGEPPSLGPLHAWLAVDPRLRFKLDPTPGWDDDLVGELARLGCVDVVDMKGSYRNVSVAMEPETGLYGRVIEGLLDAWIEDPAIEDSTAGLLERHRDRITWDEPIHSVADIEALPWRPRMLNLKPARFGSVRALFDTYDYCAEHGIGAYGGGMFEQGPGRGQLQYLASMFHPDAPNDLAPEGYNLQSPSRDLLPSPLAPEPDRTGFRWGTYDRRRTIREPVGGIQRPQ